MTYFAFRHQPFKALYVVYTAITVPLIRAPYWCISSLIPYFRPRRTWSFSRSILLCWLKTSYNFSFAVGFLPFRSPRQRQSLNVHLGEVWVDEVPKDLIRGKVEEAAMINQVSPEPISGYWFSKTGDATDVGRRALPDEKVLYYFHGGGYISGSVSPNSLYSEAPKGMLEHSFPSNARAFGLEYRLTRAAPFDPYAPFPAALLDALSGYYYLVTTLGFAPKNVIVSGDSAGGHLAVSLVRYLCLEDLTELPPPGGLIPLHPTVDWALTDAHITSSSMERNYHTDYVDPFARSGYTKRGLLGSLPEEFAYTSLWISPASLRIQETGLFPNFPPTLIIAGGAEQTLDAMRVLHTRLVEDNGTEIITYIEYPDAIHDFMCFASHEPERSKALDHDIRTWVHLVYNCNTQ